MNGDAGENILEELELNSPEKIKTPQEKKRLSYAKDCRNTYGESDKGSRKSIKRNKAFSSRRFRHAVAQALLNEIKSNDSDLLQKTVQKLTRSKWRKVSDTSLGEVVKEKVESQGKSFQAKIKRRIKYSFKYREK
jgi:hypothetical protein